MQNWNITITRGMSSNLIFACAGDQIHHILFWGTGLGLTISSELVNLMGGELKVESKPNVGTRFYSTGVFEKTKGQAVKPRLRPDLHNIQVLLVDDSKASLTALSLQLKMWNCRVDICNNGKEARQKLRQATERGIILQSRSSIKPCPK